MASPRPQMIGREFLGWDRPALLEAAGRLAARHRSGDRLDLGRVIVVVPGQRAGRRFQEILAVLAQQERLVLTPPEVLTEGRLPERMYTPKQPFAGDIVQDLAWAQALQEFPAEKRQHVIPNPPAAASAIRWMELGRVLRRLHVDLAAEGLDFAAVRRSGPRLADFGEADRWEALAALQQRYLALLDGQKLWDIQTARLKAIEFREVRTDGDIILLGTVDLTRTLRQMLDQVADRVTAYVVAPESRAADFDEHGCLVPGNWSDAVVPVHDGQLCQVDGPVEQADAVTEWLRELGGKFRTDEITIGVPDESLVPQLRRQLDQCAVRSRWVEGARFAETAAYRLLVAAVQYAGRHRYDDLAALMRHPDLEDWLKTELAASGQAPASDAAEPPLSLAAQLDAFYNARLPSRVTTGSAHLESGDWPDLAPAVKRIAAWLDGTSASLPLRAWGSRFRQMLGAVYGGRTLRLDAAADDHLYRALQGMLDQCDEASALPEALDTAAFPAADAFQVILGPLADKFLPPPAEPEAVEILGWLELPLDDAPALIVTSFNEGFVPQSTSADAFLPDRLRRELGLLHNERRYARDAYATSVLAQSRRELRIVVGRRDTHKDPLQPSRLLFACPDAMLIERARHFFGRQRETTGPRRLLLAAGAAIPDKSLFAVPRPVRRDRPLKYIAVTEFKAYIACPYRYYLRYVRNLEAVDDSARELDGGAFGTLLHRVLGSFGRDPAGPRNSERAADIFDYLAAELRQEAERTYGSKECRPALRLQMDQALERFHAFATVQAGLVRDGWQIVYAEDDGQKRLEIPFPPDGSAAPILLVGRIDRIDFHAQGKKVRILDYKTAGNADRPEKLHCAGEEWIDLQLPLYRHLWTAARLELPKNCQVELGYFNLPKQTASAGVELATWNSSQLDAADKLAVELITRIREGIFWPMKPPPDFCEDLAAICLDNLLSGPALDDDEQGGPD